jgi:hypothetical protein
MDSHPRRQYRCSRRRVVACVASFSLCELVRERRHFGRCRRRVAAVVESLSLRELPRDRRHSCRHRRCSETQKPWTAILVANIVVLVVASLSSSRHHCCASSLATVATLVGIIAAAKHRPHGQPSSSFSNYINLNQTKLN